MAGELSRRYSTGPISQWTKRIASRASDSEISATVLRSARYAKRASLAAYAETGMVSCAEQLDKIHEHWL
jgi:hypothetical protein